MKLPRWFSALFSLALACSAPAASPPSGLTETEAATPVEVPKLVWAHYVGWGFDFPRSFDAPELGWRRLDDRSLLGKWVGTDIGAGSTERIQILSAMQHGIDGFTVDLSGTTSFAGRMTRFYRAAEGLPFYVSLCVDGWPDASIDKAVARTAEFLRAFGKHPNNYFIDGKPVVFIYHPRRPLADCREIVAKLKEQGLEAYWLIQPRVEGSLWANREQIDEWLTVFDGLYDFGINGFTQEQMRTRFANGREAIARAAPLAGKDDRPVPRLLSAGITQGYIGSHNAFYRPFLGTRTLRDNWEAALASGAHWVCITTWNDYTEGTHFEPSVWGRDTLLRINREYVRRWRGEPTPARREQVFVAYKSEVRLGDDWTFEVQSFPHTPADDGAARVARVKLADLDGGWSHEFPATELAADEHRVVTHRLRHPGFDTPRILRVWAGISTAGAEDAATTWRELYPVVIRAGILRDMKTLRLALDDVLTTPLQTRLVDDDETGATLLARIEPRALVGTVDLLRNGRVVETREIAKPARDPLDLAWKLPRASELSSGAPDNLYVVRLSRADGKQSFAAPVLLKSRDATKTGEVTHEVILRAGDFDEAWMSDDGRAGRTRTVTLSASEVYGFRFPMDDEDTQSLRDTFGWNVVALGGGGNWGRSLPEARPKPSTEKTEDGGERRYLAFDGKRTRVLLQIGSFPHDTFTLEARLRPSKHSEAGYVFSDQNEAVAFGVLPDGKVFFQRGKTRLHSDVSIPTDRWTHVAAVYDGRELRLHVDGAPAGSREVGPWVRSINSVPAIGCLHREHLKFSHFYHGEIAGLSVVARPLSPEEFLLR